MDQTSDGFCSELVLDDCFEGWIITMHCKFEKTRVSHSALKCAFVCNRLVYESEDQDEIHIAAQRLGERDGSVDSSVESFRGLATAGFS